MANKEYKIVMSGFNGREYDESVSGFGASRGSILSNEADAYTRVPLIFRAIRLRCNSLTRIPYYIYNDADEIVEKYKFEDSLPLRNLLWLSEAAILLKGASYVLKNKNVYGYQRGLQWLNPFTVTAQLRGEELNFKQILPNGQSYPKSGGYWTVDDFLYFKEFNPLDDLGAGISATQVALGDGQILAGSTKFLAEFFGNDALPVTMVVLPSGTKETERERVETWFKRKLGALRGAVQRVLGVSADIKIEKLTSELKTFDFDKVDAHAVQGISDAFDIPQSLLRSTSGANKAISDNERRSFIEDTIIPRTKFYESIINPFLEEFGQRIEFVPEELTEMQEDETARAASLNQMVTAGVPVVAALDILGYDISDSSMRIIRKSERRKISQAERIANQPAVDPSNPDDLDEQDKNGQDENNPTIKAELDKWFRKAMKKMKSGKSADVEFESDIIPEDKMELIEDALKTVKNEDELKAVFGGNNGKRD
jgi:HK97 family phage portal protein